MNRMFRRPDKKACSDAGMALVLIFLLIGYFSGNQWFYVISIPALLINMAIPRFYHPFALLWFGVSMMMGRIVSGILLSLIYYALLVPIGVIRQWMGYDAMQMKPFGKGSGSVMKERNHTYTARDIERPY